MVAVTVISLRLQCESLVLYCYDLCGDQWGGFGLTLSFALSPKTMT